MHTQAGDGSLRRRSGTNPLTALPLVSTTRALALATLQCGPQCDTILHYSLVFVKGTFEKMPGSRMPPTNLGHIAADRA